ncbi:MAG: DNA starvation/stationary phase protection protein Dps [Halorientalis sp.]
MSQLHSHQQARQQQPQTQQQAPQRTEPVPQQFPTRSYLSQNVRTASIQRLNRCLADSLVLHSQAKYAHWNVKGPQFYSLHLLFDEIAEELESHIDEIGERITTLGGQAVATTYTAASSSSIAPLSTTAVNGIEFVEMLADRMATHDANLGQDIRAATQDGDVDTADLLNEVSREVGMLRWFLEAHLQGQPRQAGRSQQHQLSQQ